MLQKSIRFGQALILALGISSTPNPAVGVGSTAADMQNRVNSTLVGSKGKDSLSDIRSGSSTLSGSESLPLSDERVSLKKRIQDTILKNIQDTRVGSKGKDSLSDIRSGSSTLSQKDSQSDRLALKTTQFDSIEDITISGEVVSQGSDAITLADGTRFTSAYGSTPGLDTPSLPLQERKIGSNSGTIPFSNGWMSGNIGIQDGSINSGDIGITASPENIPFSIRAHVSKDKTTTRGLVAGGKSFYTNNIDGSLIVGGSLVQEYNSTYDTNLRGGSLFSKVTAYRDNGSLYLDTALQNVRGKNLASNSQTITDTTVQQVPGGTRTTDTVKLQSNSTDLQSGSQLYVRAGGTMNVGEQGVLDLHLSQAGGSDTNVGGGYKQFFPDQKSSLSLGYDYNGINNPASIEFQKQVSSNVSVGGFSRFDTSGGRQSSPVFGLSATLSFGSSSSSLYSRPTNSVLKLEESLRSLTTSDGVVPSNLIDIGKVTVSSSEKILSQNVTDVYDTPVLNLDMTKVVINSDDTVSFIVDANIRNIGYRYQIDDGEWINVSAYSYGWGTQRITTPKLSHGKHTIKVLAVNHTKPSEPKSFDIIIGTSTPEDHLDTFSPPKMKVTPTSVLIDGGSVTDSDNPPNTNVTIEYFIKDADGNIVDKNTLTPNTPYTVFAKYNTVDGSTSQPVSRTIKVQEIRTPDLNKPQTPEFTYDDTSNTINWNGADLSLYEMSLDGGKIWTTCSVGYKFGTGSVEVLLRKKAIEGVSYPGSAQKIVFTQDNTPGVLSEISGASVYTPGTTSQVYSVSFVDPDGILSVIAKVDGIDTLVTKKGDIYSISLPTDMSSGNHKIDFITQGMNPDGTAELVQIESMDVTVPEKVLPVVVTPDVAQGSMSGDPTMFNVLKNDHGPIGKTLELIDAKVTSGEAEINYTASGEVTVIPSSEFLDSIAPGETKTIAVSYTAGLISAPTARSVSARTVVASRSIVTNTPELPKSTLSVKYTRPALIDATASFPTVSVTKDVGQTYSQVLVTNSKGKITYSSGNTAIATVDTSGKVTFVAPGSTVITANQVADGKYKATTASYTITVNAFDPAPIAGGAFAKLGDITTYDGAGMVFPDIDASGVIDPLGRKIVYTATGLPAGFQIDPDTGIIKGVYFDENGTHEYNITIIATPKGSTHSLQTKFTWMSYDEG